MTLVEFGNVFALLAVQLRATDADEATIRGYYEALKHLELEFVQMAATELAQSAEWFPKTSEWREMTAKVEYNRLEAQRALLRKLPTPLCLACSDTGWDRSDDDRVHRCACLKLRRLELLGRRPWPELPSAQVSQELVTPEDAKTMLVTLSARTKAIR